MASSSPGRIHARPPTTEVTRTPDPLKTYDLIVIGNGSAGDNIARSLGRKGKSVAVVERDHLGAERLARGIDTALRTLHHCGRCNNYTA